MRSLMPLEVIASNITSGLNDPTGTYKFTILRHLLSTYKKFHLFVDHDFEVKTAILKPDHIVNMPCDFVYETKVGIMRNGRCAILTLDRNMAPAPLNQSEVQAQLESVWDGTYFSDLVYPFYNAGRDLYGYGTHMNRSGFYNIDKKNGTIEIGSLLPDDAEIVIEYKSDGVSDGLKLVPSELEDVLSYGAKQRFYEDKGDLRLAQWNKEQYLENYYMTKRQYNFISALYITQTAYNYTSEV